jgi:phosphatidate phosphatase APP1
MHGIGGKFCMTVFFLGGALACAAQEADPRQVIVDDAWSGARGAHFSGRLVERRTLGEEARGARKRFYHNTRLLLTSGEEGFVTWRAAGTEWTTRADDDGYWTLAMNPAPTFPPGWHRIETEPEPSSEAGLLIVDPRNRSGIISDLDDTIVVSDVLQKRVLLKNSLALAPEERVPVPGMAELYRKRLAKNPAPDSAAVFYVSASPRQLTDNLRTFLRTNNFPRGVMRLKELSETSEDSLTGDQRAYKRRVLGEIFEAFPQIRFALFGDDGEQDPEIYAELQERFPGQIEGVWIRRVHPDAKRARFAGQADLGELLPQ